MIDNEMIKVGELVEDKSKIIFQQIDINVLNNLSKQGLKLGVDYEIRRYVDDYFVFSNNKFLGSSAMVNKFGSASAIGPCFISPAG